MTRTETLQAAEFGAFDIPASYVLKIQPNVSPTTPWYLTLGGTLTPALELAGRWATFGAAWDAITEHHRSITQRWEDGWNVTPQVVRECTPEEVAQALHRELNPSCWEITDRLFLDVASPADRDGAHAKVVAAALETYPIAILQRLQAPGTYESISLTIPEAVALIAKLQDAVAVARRHS